MTTHELELLKPCPGCDGQRCDYPDTERACPDCHGTGSVPSGEVVQIEVWRFEPIRGLVLHYWRRNGSKWQNGSEFDACRVLRARVKE